ncbi:MAG: type II toxin-antitoxin system VapC family toxin [Acidimicrobiales bacterium]|nr:type II toxin-antitoxin system VapC family toxin [Acidimicrobiales bacterium]MYG62486.1 type II toxin-antitoxin system VapC family toxin [Acidimicrobiales bacterium]MYJ46984.1 type II toxin-antitoxin system VapC family toxin [Acidimicrobiales bacterium]
MIVLDTSAVIAWLLRLPEAPDVEQRVTSADSLHGPALLALETAHVLHRYVRRGDLSAEQARRALAEYSRLGIIAHVHDLLLPVIWRLRDNFTAYDASFAALAVMLDAPLVTLDARTARAPWPADLLPLRVEVLPQ